MEREQEEEGRKVGLSCGGEDNGGGGEVGRCEARVLLHPLEGDDVAKEVDIGNVKRKGFLSLLMISHASYDGV